MVEWQEGPEDGGSGLRCLRAEGNAMVEGDDADKSLIFVNIHFLYFYAKQSVLKVKYKVQKSSETTHLKGL